MAGSFSCRPAYGGYIATVCPEQSDYGPYVAPSDIVCSSEADAEAAFAAWLKENKPEKE